MRFLDRETDAYARDRVPTRGWASTRMTTWNEVSRRAISTFAIDPEIVEPKHQLKLIEA